MISLSYSYPASNSLANPVNYTLKINLKSSHSSPALFLLSSKPPSSLNVDYYKSVKLFSVSALPLLQSILHATDGVIFFLLNRLYSLTLLIQTIH